MTSNNEYNRIKNQWRFFTKAVSVFIVSSARVTIVPESIYKMSGFDVFFLVFYFIEIPVS